MLISFKVLINFDTWCLQTSLNNSSAHAMQFKEVRTFVRKLLHHLITYHMNTFSEIHMCTFVLCTARGKKVIHQTTYRTVTRSD